MARNVYTPRTAGSPADVRQYVLPWSPTEQASTPPAPMQDNNGAEPQPDGNGSATPSHNVCDPPATPIAAEPEPMPAAPARVRGNRPALSLRVRVERLLRDRGVPYVNVDEAKRALFASAKLRAFHFVAYRTDGPNWLIFAAKADRQARQHMAEWERVFGEGFVAVFAAAATGEPTGVRFRSLDGRPLGFDASAAAEREGDHAEGGGSC